MGCVRAIGWRTQAVQNHITGLAEASSRARSFGPGPGPDLSCRSAAVANAFETASATAAPREDDAGNAPLSLNEVSMMRRSSLRVTKSGAMSLVATAWSEIADLSGLSTTLRV